MQNESLQKTIASLRELYGPRNKMYMRGEGAIFQLHRHFMELNNEVFRKGAPRKQYQASRLAGLFAITIAYADSFGDIPVVEALCRKYPQGLCSYCRKNPCGCAKVRDKSLGQPNISTASAEQMNWSINDFVKNLDALYGQNNRDRGIEWAFLRLVSEIHEAEHAHMFEEMPNPDYSLDERSHRLAKEFADALAWIFAISAMLEIDLGAEVRKRYGGNCHRCGQRPCKCGPYNVYTIRALPDGDDAAQTVTET